MTASPPLSPNTFQRISPEDGHYFHGFCSLQPWNTDQTRFLCHRLPFADRMPNGSHSATVGWIDTASEQFHPIAETAAWNFQLGSMIQWIDEDRVIYNVRAGEQITARVHSLSHGPLRDLHSTFFVVMPGCSAVVGFDMTRGYAVNPGYSYGGTAYPLFERPAPENEGMMLMDVETGNARMLVSLKQLTECFSFPGWSGEPALFGRLLPSPCGRQILFSFRYWEKESGTRHTTVLLIDVASGGVSRVVPYDWQAAHLCWEDLEHILVWLKRPPSGLSPGFFRIACANPGSLEPVAAGKLTSDGHLAVFDGGKKILTDTFPVKERGGHQLVLYYDLQTDTLEELGDFPSRETGSADLRCDLHPCLSPDEKWVSVDSFHEPFRGVYAARCL